MVVEEVVVMGVEEVVFHRHIHEEMMLIRKKEWQAKQLGVCFLFFSMGLQKTGNMF